MEVGYQVIALAVTILGVILSLKIASGDGQDHLNSWALLSYPAIALALSLLWAHNDSRGRQIGKFIREYIEPHYIESRQGAEIGLEGWEHYLWIKSRKALKSGMDLWPHHSYRVSAGLIFLAAEAVAIVVAIVFDPSLLTYPHYLMLVFPVGCFLLMIGILLRYGLKLWIGKVLRRDGTEEQTDS